MASKKSTKKATSKTSAPKKSTAAKKADGLCVAGCGVEQIPGATFCHHCNVPQ